MSEPTLEIKSFLQTVWDKCDSSLEKNKENTHQQKLSLKHKIESLSKGEYCYIFKIILKHNESFTKNSNGVFIDLNSLSDDCLKEISSYIHTVCAYKVDTGIQYIVEDEDIDL